MRHRLLVSAAAATVLVAAAAPLRAQDAAQNAANNPLTPKITLNLQDYYVPQIAGVPHENSNQALLRGLMPHKTFGVGQLFRFTLPLTTVPTPGGHTTDIGDTTLMDLLVFRAGKIELGGGPLLVAPTGNHTTGSGKWQAGAAGIVIAPQKWGLIGGLMTYQHSFAGDDGRKDVSVMTVQPLLLYNLPKGLYLRSTATWTFDYEGRGDYIPLGFGAGKIWQVGSTTLNAFVEPQYTVWNNGPGTPTWQIFFGLNLQFAIKK